MKHLSIRIARERLGELQLMQQELMKTQEPDGTWEWFLQIEMMDLITFILLSKENEKARLAGRTSLRTRLKYLVVSILREDRNKGKRDAA